MSQLESWDPRPEAPKEVRGEYQAISTATPGVQIGEYLPKLARQTERLAIVRSCRHRARDHRQAAFWTLTGVPPIQLDGVMVSDPVLPTRDDKPCLGSMVVFLTEFGRQPLINQAAGRDHLPDCYSVAFAGGGIRGGQVYGRSDRLAAEVEDGACGPPDLHATVFHALGIDFHATLSGPGGKAVPLAEGKPLPLFG